MADFDINEFMTRMKDSFIPEKAVGVDATIQFNLSGTHAGLWHIIIRDGKFSVAQGAAPTAPQMTLSASSDDLIKVFTGQLDGMQAFLQGKIKVAGDLSLAMKLMGLFKMK
jgi:putative sterol carrier protein